MGNSHSHKKRVAYLSKLYGGMMQDEEMGEGETRQQRVDRLNREYVTDVLGRWAPYDAEGLENHGRIIPGGELTVYEQRRAAREKIDRDEKAEREREELEFQRTQDAEKRAYRIKHKEKVERSEMNHEEAMQKIAESNKRGKYLTEGINFDKPYVKEGYKRQKLSHHLIRPALIDAPAHVRTPNRFETLERKIGPVKRHPLEGRGLLATRDPLVVVILKLGECLGQPDFNKEKWRDLANHLKDILLGRHSEDYNIYAEVQFMINNLLDRNYEIVIWTAHLDINSEYLYDALHTALVICLNKAESTLKLLDTIRKERKDKLSFEEEQLEATTFLKQVHDQLFIVAKLANSFSDLSGLHRYSNTALLNSALPSEALHLLEISLKIDAMTNLKGLGQEINMDVLNNYDDYFTSSEAYKLKSLLNLYDLPHIGSDSKVRLGKLEAMKELAKLSYPTRDETGRTIEDPRVPTNFITQKNEIYKYL